MTTIDEGRLRFIFGDVWQIDKYDECTFYRKRICALDEAKAVDFAGIGPGPAVYLIEVKDFRNHPGPNPDAFCRAAEEIADPRKTIKIILWFEQDMHQSKPALSTLANQLKSKIGWVSARVFVVETATHGVPDLQVQDRP